MKSSCYKTAFLAYKKFLLLEFTWAQLAQITNLGEGCTSKLQHCQYTTAQLHACQLMNELLTVVTLRVTFALHDTIESLRRGLRTASVDNCRKRARLLRKQNRGVTRTTRFLVATAFLFECTLRLLMSARKDTTELTPFFLRNKLIGQPITRPLPSPFHIAKCL